MHAGDSVGVVGGGEAGASSIFLGPMVEEGVLCSQGVGYENREEVVTTTIASLNSIWSEYFFVFVTGTHTNLYVDVTTNYDLCVWIVGTEQRVI